MSTPHYERLRTALKDEPRPVAFVDLDALESNIDKLVAPVRRAGKTLRPATKSLRCRDLLRRIAERGGEAVQGLMVFSAVEAEWLVARGATDVFVAYPTGQLSDALALARANEATSLSAAVVVDDVAHLELLQRAGGSVGSTIPVVVEVDLAYRPLGGAAHLGARRSPLRTARAVVDLARRAEDFANVCFAGVMGYESHIAGLQDDNPFSPLMNRPKQWLKRFDKSRVAGLRAEVAARLDDAGLGGRLFNGGGTGSVAWTSEEPHITEVTAGSGFVDSALFDYFKHMRADPLTPALGFSLQVVRVPGPGWVTAH
ncbi:MAG: alanine racemase, partial [Deltaproteobacteria bacterium]|nr:alanine racemase [Deltaproteobacteria bacterium]